MRPQAMLSRRCSPPEIPRTRRPPGSRPPTCRVHSAPQRNGHASLLAMADEQAWRLFRLPQAAAFRRCLMGVPEAQSLCLCKLLVPTMSLACSMEQPGGQPETDWL